MAGEIEILEESYLDHIIIFLRANDPDSTLFGSLIDNWFCYRKGGAFVKSTGNTVTFSRSRLKSNSHVLRHDPDIFISQRAEAVMAGASSEELQFEHSIPRAALHKAMLARKDKLTTREAVRAFLDRCYRVALVTVNEHDELKKFNHSMPGEWDWDDPKADCYARYSAVGIARYMANEGLKFTASA